MSSLLPFKIRVRLLFMYFFFIRFSRVSFWAGFHSRMDIVFAPCIHANKWESCSSIMVLVYTVPKLNSSLVTNALFVQLEDVEGVLMRIEPDPPPCILGICCLIQVAALLLLILKLTEPPNTWKSEYLFLGRYIVDLFTHFKARPISQTSRFDIPS